MICKNQDGIIGRFREVFFRIEKYYYVIRIRASTKSRKDSVTGSDVIKGSSAHGESRRRKGHRIGKREGVQVERKTAPSNRIPPFVSLFPSRFYPLGEAVSRREEWFIRQWTMVQAGRKVHDGNRISADRYGRQCTLRERAAHRRASAPSAPSSFSLSFSPFTSGQGSVS